MKTKKRLSAREEFVLLARRCANSDEIDALSRRIQWRLHSFRQKSLVLTKKWQED